MKTKIFTLVLAVMASVGSVSAVSGTCGNNLTWDLTNDVLTISGTGTMTNYTSSSSPWYSYRSSITSVVIEEGVTNIGNYAFQNCSGLTSVTIPNSVTSIGENAFYNCHNLTSVTIPNSVTSIGISAFLKCTGLTSVTIPNSVTSIGGSAFSACSGLTSVTIPNSVTSIGNSAFYNCSGLTSVTIGNGVTSIGSSAFQNCSGLTSIIVENGNTVYDSRNDCNAIIETATNTLIAGCQNTIIPNSVTSIGNSAFAYCSGLTSVTIPNSVTSIGYEAFYGCSGLTSVTIGNGVTSIGISAFAYCSGLTSVHINTGSITIDKSLFGTANITIGENVEKITIWNDIQNTITYLNPNTLISIASAYAPASNKSIYDTDGDGEMEFISGAVLYNKNGEKVGDLPTLKTNSSYYSYYYFANFNNDAYIDIAPYTTTLGNYYINVNSSYNVLPVDLSNAPNYIYTYTSYKPSISHFQLDANLDGQMDFYSVEDINTSTNPTGTHYFHLRQADGSYLKKELKIITATAAIDSALLEIWESSANSGLTPMYWSTMPSISDGWMHAAPKRNGISEEESLQPLMMRRVTAATSAANAFTSLDVAIDLDRNGLIDLMSSTTGAVLYNLGDYRFLKGQFPGQVTVKDLNGDGIMDYIIYDATNKIVTLQIYEGDGMFKTQTLMQNMAISNVWCYDFDNDGDVDVLLPFDYTKTSGYAYLVFFRNDGNNTFKKVENAFDDPQWHFKFMGCKDVDNDGKYEIIAIDSVGDATQQTIRKGDYYLVRYNNKLKVSVDNAPFISNTITSSTSTPYFMLGDFDNDGILDYWSQYGSYYTLSHFSPISPNTAPAKMSRPRFILDATRQMLNISWERGSDNECSALDLEYSIRIGSASGKSDIWFAAAGADGKQRSLWGGNVGAWLNQWVNVAGWAEGDYYISVQAIDPSGLGGAWSDEVVYHHSLLSADFAIDKLEISTVDTLTIQYSGVVNPNYTYTWNFGDSAIVISQEAQTYRLAWNTGGIKTISLQVTDNTGRTSPIVKKQVQIDAVRFDKVSYYCLSYVDLDGDGVMDGLGNNSSSTSENFGFYTCKNGEFKKIAKTYNTDLTNSQKYARPSCMNVWDYNMDGLPDIIFPTNKGNVMLNQEDLDIEFKNIQFKTNSYVWTEGLYNPTLINAENTGYLNIYGNYNSGNTGGLSFLESTDSTYTFTTATQGLFGYSRIINIYKWYDYPVQAIWDYNGDGLMDAVGQTSININNGDGTYTTIEKGNAYGLLEDFNNDGYPDFMDWKNAKTLRCYLGDAENSYSQYVEMTLPQEYSRGSEYYNRIYSARDIDNNGYLDLLIYGDYINGARVGFVVYIYPDWSIAAQAIELGSSSYGIDELILNGYPFADINGDGIPELAGTDYCPGNTYSLKSRITNEAPTAPTNLRVAQTEKGVLCSWDAGKDRETPAAQMKYNISIKKKGANVGEENAFIISPVNGLSDDAAIVPGYPYWRGTNFIVPISRFEVGQEYELQVQSIDLWGAHSAMTAPLTFQVEQQISISMPTEVCKGTSVHVNYIGTESGEQAWNFDGGVATGNNTNGYNVMWNTGGVKTVTLTINGITSTRTILVRDNDDTDLSFSLPEYVLSDTWVEFTLPEAFKDPAAKIKMRTSDNIEDADCVKVKDETDVHYSCLGKIQRLQGTLKARVRFNKSNSVEQGWIEFYQEDSICGEKNNYRAKTQVMGYAPAPAISIVTVDAATGKNQIYWDAPADLPDWVDRIYIYKEEGSTNNWVRQAEIALSAGSWIDLASDPAVRKNRYRMTYGTTFGAESNMSTAHSSTHLQMNVGLQGANNLIWTKYEGGTIDSYRILRGTTPDNMTVIATVPGTEYTYTDLNAPEGVYYALEYDNLYFEKWVWITSSGAPAHMPAATTAATRNGHSNIMASSASSEVTFAEKINICAMERNIELTAEQTSLHLYAEILPAMATYKRASWSIVSGQELATIDDSGLLTAKEDVEDGTVRVRATAIDGSGIYAEKDIPITGMKQTVLISQITLNSISGGTTFTNTNAEIVVEATITPAEATNKELSWTLVSGADKVSIVANGAQCTLTLKTEAENGEVVLSATAQDGSGVYGTLTLTVNKEVEIVFYTIQFKNYNDTLLQSIQVQEGMMPVYAGATPTRDEDEENVYTFIGWTPNVVVATADAVYTAVYEATPKSQDVDDLETTASPRKLLRDNQVLILRGNKTYTLTGQEVK